MPEGNSTIEAQIKALKAQIRDVMKSHIPHNSDIISEDGIAKVKVLRVKLEALRASSKRSTEGNEAEEPLAKKAKTDDIAEVRRPRRLASDADGQVTNQRTKTQGTLELPPYTTSLFSDSQLDDLAPYEPTQEELEEETKKNLADTALQTGEGGSFTPDHERYDSDELEEDFSNDHADKKSGRKRADEDHANQTDGTEAGFLDDRSVDPMFAPKSDHPGDSSYNDVLEAARLQAGHEPADELEMSDSDLDAGLPRESTPKTDEETDDNGESDDLGDDDDESGQDVIYASSDSSERSGDEEGEEDGEEDLGWMDEKPGKIGRTAASAGSAGDDE